MKWFEILERIIGHIAWPLAALLIVSQFSNELRQFIRRIRNAKYKGVELDLGSEIQEIKNDAEIAGITIYYPAAAFPEASIKNIEAAPELAFIQSWQEIENVLFKIYSKEHKAYRGPITLVLAALVQDAIIDETMSSLIKKLQIVRNKIVHATDPDITKGEALEWLGISKSVKNRLSQKLLQS